MSEPKKIWDVPTRIIHWGLAITVTLNVLILETGDEPHKWVGYAALIFVLGRFVLGFFGSEHSRFFSFPISVAEIIYFSKNVLNKNSKDYSGHNPAASIVYLLIWMCVIGLGITGWMMGLDAYFGVEWLMDLHELISHIIEALVIFHLLGMLIDAYKFKRKTWLAMIKGSKA